MSKQFRLLPTKSGWYIQWKCLGIIWLTIPGSCRLVKFDDSGWYSEQEAEKKLIKMIHQRVQEILSARRYKRKKEEGIKKGPKIMGTPKKGNNHEH